jgi:hypothetical protein
MPRPIRSLGHNNATTRPSNLNPGSLRQPTSTPVVPDSGTSTPDSSFDGTNNTGPRTGLSGLPSGGLTPATGSGSTLDVRTGRTSPAESINTDPARPPDGTEVYGYKLGKTVPGTLEHIVSGFVSAVPGTLTVEEAAVHKACVGLNGHFSAHLRVSLRGRSDAFTGERMPQYVPGGEFTTARPLKTKEKFEMSYCAYVRDIAAVMLKKRLGREPGMRELAKNTGTIIKKSGVDPNQFVKAMLRGGKPEDIAFAAALRRYLR